MASALSKGSLASRSQVPNKTFGYVWGSRVQDQIGVGRVELWCGLMDFRHGVATAIFMLLVR